MEAGGREERERERVWSVIGGGWREPAVVSKGGIEIVWRQIQFIYFATFLIYFLFSVYVNYFIVFLLFLYI